MLVLLETSEGIQWSFDSLQQTKDMIKPFELECNTSTSTSTNVFFNTLSPRVHANSLVAYTGFNIFYAEEIQWYNAH